MHVRVRLPPAPPPPHLHLHRRGLVSAAGADTAASASASSPHPSLQHPRKHPSLTSIPAPRSCTHPPLCQTSLLQQPPQDSSQASPPCRTPLFPPARPGLATTRVPLSRPLRRHPLSEASFRKKQASCLFLLSKCLLAGQLVSHCPCGG